MKIVPFDPNWVAWGASNGSTLGVFSGGSNSALGDISGGGDVVGQPGDYTVVGLRRQVSLASNLGPFVLGDVLTIVQTSPALAKFATPSNAAVAAGSNNVAVGTLTPDGSPQTITTGAPSFNAEFPGLARLDANRVLIVYRKGTDHHTAGNIIGKIGVLAADKGSVASWSSEFTIEDAANDLRVEDGVSIIDGQVVIAVREFTGSDNVSPHILVASLPAASFSPAATWTRYNIALSSGSVQNYTQGKVLKLQDGTYLCAVGWDSGGTHTVGVVKVTSLTDWSSPTVVTVGSGANDYAEIAVEEMPGGELRAHIRTASGTSHYKSYSGNRGSTWSTPATVYTAEGYPTFRRLASGLMLAIYRHSPNGDTAWRYAANSGDTGWSSETILDSTGTRSAYATLLQLTDSKILCAYGVEYSSDGLSGGADIFSQVFTDSSTFASAAYVSVDQNDQTADYLNNKLAAGSNITFTIEQPYGAELIRISAPPPSVSVGSNSTAVREVSTIGASTTLFSPFDHAHEGVYALTSSSSNTLQRGTVNLRSGPGISLTATDTNGNGVFDTVTISGAGSGGGGSSGTGQGLVDYGFTKRTAGDITVNGTSWANLDTGMDIVLTAQTADVIEVHLNTFYGATAVTVGLDVVTVVGGSPVNSLATGAAPDNANSGIAGCSIASGLGAVSIGASGSTMYTLQSGDISGGTVTLRVRVRTGTAANRTVSGTVVRPTFFSAKNLGQGL